MRKALVVAAVLTLPFVVHAGPTEEATSGDNPVALAVALDTFHHGSARQAIEALQSYRGGSSGVNSVEVEYVLGRAWLEAGEPELARTSLEAVAASSHILADYALLHLGQAQLEMGDTEAAMETLQRFMELEPAGRLTRTAELHLANAYANAKEHTQAADLYVQIEIQGAAGDETRESILLRAALEKEAAGDIDDAVVLHTRIWRDYPTTPESEVAEARLNALARLGVAGAKDYRDFGNRFYRALALSGQGKRDEAINELNRLREQYPHRISADFELRRGYTYFRAKRYREARAVLARAIARSRSARLSAEAMFWHARANSRMGNPNTARKEYRALYEAYPTSRWAKKGLWLSGHMSLDAGQFKQAAADFQFYVDAFPRQRDHDEALWWQAWCYYRMNWPKSADASLRRLITEHRGSSLVKQAHYWRARIAMQRGQKTRAINLYRMVEETWPYTYYGLMARSQLLALGEPVTEFTLPPNPSPIEIDEDCPASETEYRFFAARSAALLKLGFLDEAAYELRRARSATSERGCLLQIAKKAYEASDFHTVQYIARNYMGEEINLETLRSDDPGWWYYSYPKAYEAIVRERADHYGFQPELVWALMREESTFRPEVVSPVGAIGLLQIMPYTGEKIARRMGVKDFEPNQLYEPRTNISFSTWYVNGLLGRWGGNEALAIASYNGGPHAVARWLEEGPDLDPDEFIEEIGYSETRRYVKRVLKSYQMYLLLYDSGPPHVVLGEHMDKSPFVVKADGTRNTISEIDTSSPDYPNF